MPTIEFRSISSSPPKKNVPWHLGNTTVRNPYRIAGALRVLASSDFHGRLGDESAQAAFLRQLHEEDVVARMDVDEKTAAWNGRKWRSAMYQLGFITPELRRRLPAGSTDDLIVHAAGGMQGISGAQYEITPNGRRLANAETVAGAQDCFLRSILAYRVPSPIESHSHRNVASFSPLRVVLTTLLALDAAGAEPCITFEEMASLVQFCKSEDAVPLLVEQLLRYREARKSTQKKRRIFDAEFRSAALALNSHPVKAPSLTDYADVNFRYLKATGLVSGQGMSIAVTDGKLAFVREILAEEDVQLDEGAYFRRLWEGAALPTDRAGEAANAILELERELRSLGWSFGSLSITGRTPPELDQMRLWLLEERRVIKERSFGREQRTRTGEILDMLHIMDEKSQRQTLYRSEAPAYLEWTFWRAFLAINALVNEPWDVRQFQVGQDLLPIFTAPSRRPDIICEFEDWVLVVEVTFTESSRQEAMEGEPVRRHVADVVELQRVRGKRVFGLFVAPNIDPNTAETFGRGTWVYPDGRRVAVDIVPLTIRQFIAVFASGFERARGLGPEDIRSFIDGAIAGRSTIGESWKQLIATQIEMITGPPGPAST